MRTVIDVVLIFVIGFISGYLFFTKVLPVEPMTVSTVDTLMIRKLKDYRMALRKLPILRVDTFWRSQDSIQLMYEIPIMPFHFVDSLPLSINDERHYAKFDLTIDGYVTEYSIMTQANRFYYSEPKRKLDWRAVGIGALGVGILTVAILLLAK